MTNLSSSSKESLSRRSENAFSSCEFAFRLLAFQALFAAAQFGGAV